MDTVPGEVRAVRLESMDALQRLERKIDALDEKIDMLIAALAEEDVEPVTGFTLDGESIGGERNTLDEL